MNVCYEIGVTQLPEQTDVTLDIPFIQQCAKLGIQVFPPSSSLVTLLCKLLSSSVYLKNDMDTQENFLQGASGVGK